MRTLVCFRTSCRRDFPARIASKFLLYLSKIFGEVLPDTPSRMCHLVLHSPHNFHWSPFVSIKKRASEIGEMVQKDYVLLPRTLLNLSPHHRLIQVPDANYIPNALKVMTSWRLPSQSFRTYFPTLRYEPHAHLHLPLQSSLIPLSFFSPPLSIFSGLCCTVGEIEVTPSLLISTLRLNLYPRRPQYFLSCWNQHWKVWSVR